MEVTTQSIVDKAVLLNVKLSKFGNSRRIKDDRAVMLREDATTGKTADADLIRSNKTLLDSLEVISIGKLDSEIREYIYRMSAPALVLEGLHFVANDVIEQVDRELNEYAGKRAVLVALAGDTYLDRVQETAIRLGPAYNSDDYPSKEEFMGQFEMSWRFLALAVPDKLKDKPELWERENEKAEAKMVEASVAIRQRMRENFLDIVSHMADRLSGEREGGKTKIFRDSMLENAQQFIAGFAFRNLTEDDELASLVAEFQSTLADITAQDLRSDADLRANTLAGVQEIQGKLNVLIGGAA